MTENEFARLAAAGYNRVPLVLETFADLDTPLSIYLNSRTVHTAISSNLWLVANASAAIPS